VIYREKTGKNPESRPFAGAVFPGFPFDISRLRTKFLCQEQGIAETDNREYPD
jgi:hypothetical protein